MSQVSEQFGSVNQVGIESFETLAKATFAGFECLAALNLNTARSILEQSTQHSRTVLTAGDPVSLLSLQSSLAQVDSSKAADYSSRVFEIASQTRGVLSKVVESQYSGMSSRIEAAIGEAVKTAPVGSDLALEAIRTALLTVDTAYDGMNLMAKQANDQFEANLAFVNGLLARQGKKAAQAA